MGYECSRRGGSSLLHALDKDDGVSVCICDTTLDLAQKRSAAYEFLDDFGAQYKTNIRLAPSPSTKKPRRWSEAYNRGHHE